MRKKALCSEREGVLMTADSMISVLFLCGKHCISRVWTGRGTNSEGIDCRRRKQTYRRSWGNRKLNTGVCVENLLIIALRKHWTRLRNLPLLAAENFSALAMRTLPLDSDHPQFIGSFHLYVFCDLQKNCCHQVIRQEALFDTACLGSWLSVIVSNLSVERCFPAAEKTARSAGVTRPSKQVTSFIDYPLLKSNKAVWHRNHLELCFRHIEPIFRSVKVWMQSRNDSL
jgi:hypothetical protein